MCASGPHIKKNSIAFFKCINVTSYDDINLVEQEIRRLLRCSSQRMPVCMTAEPYVRFRCRLLQMLMAEDDGRRGQSSESEVAVHLSQGLVAKAVFCKSQVTVSLGWWEKKEEEEEEEEEDAAAAAAAAASTTSHGKRRRKGSACRNK